MLWTRAWLVVFLFAFIAGLARADSIFSSILSFGLFWVHFKTIFLFFILFYHTRIQTLVIRWILVWLIQTMQTVLTLHSKLVHFVMRLFHLGFAAHEICSFSPFVSLLLFILHCLFFCYFFTLWSCRLLLASCCHFSLFHCFSYRANLQLFLIFTTSFFSLSSLLFISKLLRPAWTQFVCILNVSFFHFFPRQFTRLSFDFRLYFIGQIFFPFSSKISCFLDTPTLPVNCSSHLGCICSFSSLRELCNGCYSHLPIPYFFVGTFLSYRMLSRDVCSPFRRWFVATLSIFCEWLALPPSFTANEFKVDFSPSFFPFLFFQWIITALNASPVSSGWFQYLCHRLVYRTLTISVVFFVFFLSFGFKFVR